MSGKNDKDFREDLPQQGRLYVVATPIGNMADITLRAIQILKEADLIAAEDTRRTKRLLYHHKIENQLISFHEHNEVKRTGELLKKLMSGLSIAVVSNAGTPTISDPGYRLVKAAVEHNIKIIPVPGVSAAITALSASGLPTDAFIFLGFLSRKKGKRQQQLNRLINERKTMILYESPKRILTLLEDIIHVMGDRHGVLSREMTKRHEEFLHGRLTHLLHTLEKRMDIKGECTLLVAGNAGQAGIALDDVRKELRKQLESVDQQRVSDFAKEMARRYGLSRQTVYNEVLRLKASDHESD